MREKLIELLRAVQYQGNAVHGYHDKYVMNSELADHLIANGVTVQKWIPVTERLPEGRSFLVTDTDGYVGEAYLREGKIYWMCDDYDDFWADVHTVDVTHWMPLPEPPKGE